MITVLIRVNHGPEALVMTLSALVPAVAAGLVGDAVILASAQDDQLSAVADAAGATLVMAPEGSWRKGSQVARREWLLCLNDGDIPQEGWIRVLDRFIAQGHPDRHLGRLRRRKAGLVQRAFDLLGNVSGSSSIRVGDLVHRRILLDEVKVRSPVRLSAIIERDPAFG
jgi:hypothetical protein